jgi:cystathionine beta-lyase/cystathionine gamma-synthase
MSAASNYRAETLAIHAGQEPDPVHGAVMQPIVLSSTFAQDGPGNHKGFDYSRSGNPTRLALEGCLAALEGAAHGMAFASGCAATTTLLHTLSPGDHVICGDDVYGGTYRIFHRVMAPFGLQTSVVDLGDIKRVEAAIQPTTRMIWVETPSNPMLKIFDIAALAQLARSKNLLLVVDNTFATPMLQRPLALGADVVLHSTTKYINGHSDAVGGFVCTSNEEVHEKLRFLQNAMGGVPSPFDCYMVLRGSKTLGVRMKQHVESAKVLAQRLAEHPHVENIRFPGLASHPDHELASRQMSGPGGMISFVLKGNLEQASAFLRVLKVFVCAESLGGVESLAELPAIMTHASVPADLRRSLGINDGLIRLSVGLEHIEDLWADLEQGFVAATKA